MRNIHTASLGLLITVLLGGPLIGSEETGSSAPQSSSAIERVYIDRSSSHDPGTIVVVLNNDSDSNLEVGDIRVNGVRVKDRQSPSDPVLWHRVSHSVLAPDQKGLIILKLAQYSQGMVRLQVTINGKAEETLLSAADSEPVRVAAVRYSADRTSCNLFVSNTGGAPEQLEHVKLNGHIVWTAGPEGLSIPPDATGLVCISLDEPLDSGQAVQWYLYLSNRVVGLRDRVKPGFRISVESGDQDLARQIGADPLVLDSFQFRQTGIADNSVSEATPSTDAGKTEWSLIHVPHSDLTSGQAGDLTCVFACPTHATDSYHTSAYLSMAAQQEVEKQSGWHSFIHACRAQPLRGLAMFGQIADCVRFNGQLKTSVNTVDANRDEVPWTVYQLTDYAVRSASPSLALPMIPIEKDQVLFPRRSPLGVELRQMAYAAISAGAGGLVYRIVEQDWPDPDRDRAIEEVSRVNHEISQLRDYLTMGFPRPIGHVNDPQIQLTCIDAGPKGMVLILLNHDLDRFEDGLNASVEPNEHHDLAVEVTIPENLTIKGLYEIDDTAHIKLENFRREGDHLSVEIPSIGASKTILVKSQGPASLEDEWYPEDYYLRYYDDSWRLPLYREEDLP